MKLAHGSGGYQGWTSDVALFTGGETLTITATGAKVPAFEATLPAPAHLAMNAPVYPLGSPMPIDKTQDLVFEWSGESVGEMEIRISGPQQLPEPQTDIHCRFPASAGTGTVPAAVLSKVTLSGSGTIAADVAATREVVTAGWGPVSLRASSPALKPNGVQYSTSLTWP